MIVVKIELWGGTRDRGDYNVAVCRKGNTDVPIEIYPEAQQRLISRALRSAFPEEK